MIRRAVLAIIGLVVLAIIAFLVWPEKRYAPYEVSLDYQAQVDAFNVPDMPQAWTWASFAGDDGVKMRWGQMPNREASDTTVIIIPGYTATMNMYGEHITHLTDRGYHVMGFDLRGQGGSERPRIGQPEKLMIDDFSRYSNELSDFIKSQNFSEDRNVILIGMSLGGHVAMRLSGDHPGVIDGLLLLAPALQPVSGDVEFDQALKIMKWGRRLGKDNRYLPGQSNWVPYHEANLLRVGIEHCASNPDRLPLRDAIFTNIPEQRVGGITFNWGIEFFESSLYLRADDYLENISLPITMIHAELDLYVETDVNISACDARLPNCKNVQYAGSGHCLFNESDDILEKIYVELDQLKTRIASP